MGWCGRRVTKDRELWQAAGAGICMIRRIKWQNVNRPPPYTWVPAPIGWWFKGPFNRKLAHIWPGSDKRIHAVVLRGPDSLPRGPFTSEDAAMQALAAELAPIKTN